MAEAREQRLEKQKQVVELESKEKMRRAIIRETKKKEAKEHWWLLSELALLSGAPGESVEHISAWVLKGGGSLKLREAWTRFLDVCSQ